MPNEEINHKSFEMNVCDSLKYWAIKGTLEVIWNTLVLIH